MRKCDTCGKEGSAEEFLSYSLVLEEGKPTILSPSGDVILVRGGLDFCSGTCRDEFIAGINGWLTVKK